MSTPAPILKTPSPIWNFNNTSPIYEASWCNDACIAGFGLLITFGIPFILCILGFIYHLANPQVGDDLTKYGPDGEPIQEDPEPKKHEHGEGAEGAKEGNGDQEMTSKNEPTHS